jgi:hypothetical protein
VDKLLQASVDRLGPVKKMREETDLLRRRLEELEAALGRIEVQPKPQPESTGEQAKKTVPHSGPSTEPSNKTEN